MKTFLEEYGLVIVGVVAIAMLIALVLYFTSDGNKKIRNNFDQFTTKSNTAVNDALSPTGN